MKPMLIVITSLLVAGIVFGQTSDGETPANEGVCDDLMWSTPGLYGLCIAYCEAQDLDLLDPEDPDTIRSAIPKTKILDNYNRKRDDGDPEMPCVRAPIPCWTPEEIDEIGFNEGHVRIYRHAIYSCPGWRVGETWYVEERGFLPEGREYQFWAGAWYDSETGEQGCWYKDSRELPETSRSFLITPSEYAEAEGALVTHAEEVLGWGIWQTRFPEDPGATCQ